MTNIFVDNNTSGGIYIYLSNNTLLTNAISNKGQANAGVQVESSLGVVLINASSNNSFRGIWLYNSGNISMTNVRVFNDSLGIQLTSANNSMLANIEAGGNILEGIDFEYSNNNFLINSSAYNTSQNDGVYLHFSNNNTLFNITSTNNTYYGVYLLNSENNSLLKIRANNNVKNGGYLLGSNNNFISDFTANNNLQDGISLWLVNYTSLTNLLAIGNSLNGIDLSSSNNNTLINISSINNSKYGINLYSNSSSNTIRNSFIQMNNLSGLFFNSTYGPSQYNFIYNNYFNNSFQYTNLSSSSNFFNISKTSGTNIVGGNYLGGNYWAAPNGSGFSQMCVSGTDGICDLAYSIDGINYDYLPLICAEKWSCGGWSSCSLSGVQTRTCTDANSCQTYKSIPPLSQSCTPISGSSEVPILNLGTIISGQPASVNVNNPNLDLVNIKVTTNQNVTGASLTISKQNNANLKIELPFGTIYNAFQFNTTGINENNLENVTIEFRVNSTWLENYNSTYNDVILYRKPNMGNWSALATNSIKNDSTYYYFTALSPGFSTFIILIGSQETAKCRLFERRCFNNEVQSCDANGNWTTVKQCDVCENADCVQMFLGIRTSLIYYGAMILAVIVIFALLSIINKKKNRKIKGKNN